MIRLTASAPEALRDDCNALAMCLAFGPPDGNTYGALNWQDTNGNLYAAASFIALEHWIIAASQPLQRPEWDTDNYVNMAGANRAQAAMVVWLGGDDPIPQARPDKLTVVAGDDGLASLAAMGLVAVEEEE
jgi:hypothetical protein